MGGTGVGDSAVGDGLGLGVGGTDTVWQAVHATIKRPNRRRIGWITELSTGASYSEVASSKSGSVSDSSVEPKPSPSPTLHKP